MTIRNSVSMHFVADLSKSKGRCKQEKGALDYIIYLDNLTEYLLHTKNSSNQRNRTYNINIYEYDIYKSLDPVRMVSIIKVILFYFTLPTLNYTFYNSHNFKFLSKKIRLRHLFIINLIL